MSQVTFPEICSHEKLMKLAPTGEYGLIVERLPGGHYTEQDHVTDDIVAQSHMMAENLFGSPPVIAVRKGSPYRKYFNKVISNVLCGGLYLYWEGEMSRKYLHSRFSVVKFGNKVQRSQYVERSRETVSSIMALLNLDTSLTDICHEYGKLFGNEKQEVKDSKKDDRKSENEQFEPEIVWKNIFLFAILHTGGLWGLWRFLTIQCHLLTVIWTLAVGFASAEGVMVGNHRFFSHKTFKGNTWFKLLAIITQTIAGQNCVYIWSRDHRLHHKYSDTDADPHNSTRGFFFCHMGWLLQRKHPMVKLKGKNIDMSDLEAEPLVMFQKKYYYLLYAVFAFGIPVFVPVYCWGESFSNALLIPYFFRYMLILHGTWTVNSFAHMYGYRPYSKDIVPVESEFVAFISSGEGWHNYHHTFPWDYRAGEFGKRWNVSSHIVDWFASIGWAYDLKCATPEMIKYRVSKRGDGTHPSCQREEDVATDDTTIKPKMKTPEEDQSFTKFGEDDSEDIYGDKISSEGFTLLKRARA